jgi:hypothetical protein
MREGDFLGCFASVIDAGSSHTYIVVGPRLPREIPQLRWVNTVLEDFKPLINGDYKAFKFREYASQYLGAFRYRFHCRARLDDLLKDLAGHTANSQPIRERQIRGVAEVYD